MILDNIKTAVQNKLYQNCIKEYQQELRCQTDPYLLWIQENESLDSSASLESRAYGERAYSSRTGKEAQASFTVVFIEQCGASFSLAEVSSEYILFVSEHGSLSTRAFRAFQDFFENHADIDIAYADEDVWMLPIEADNNRTSLIARREINDEIVHRIFPWTKPIWSPDTLFSFLYFGNIFAVRTKAFAQLPWLGDSDYKKNIYDFALKATDAGKNVGNIDKILFHSYRKGQNRAEIEESLMHEIDFIGAGTAYNAIRQAAMERRGLKGEQYTDSRTQISYPIYQVENSPLVSIIIPSKDNEKVLKQCIRSIYRFTAYKNFEIIVVDNGSAQQTKQTLEEFRKECAFTYLYQSMEFNFSKMCNLGAKAAKGDFILLLNDDMEVIEELWLSKMVGQASLAHVGAVGAKLLYPNTTFIQHAGITNTIYGPGHKLKKMKDNVPYYYGRNWFIYNVIGVTAACLLVRSEVYRACGGLYEELAVAYNDVDFCFRLYEKGLCNVQRNDVVLYHHESLSRGDDMQDEQKLKRLIREKERLYQRHRPLYRNDPYIGTLLNAGEPEFSCRWLEGYELVNTAGTDSILRKGKPLPREKSMNQAIMVVVEDCGRDGYIRGEFQKTHYLIKGWAYVPNVDNARYSYKLLFRSSTGNVWELPIQKRYRKDVAAILPDETNVEMTGFCCWITENVLPPDTYQLWITAKDRCSRQRLYRNTKKTLVVE